MLNQHCKTNFLWTAMHAGLVSALTFAVCTTAVAQQPSVYTSGLQNPSKIIVGSGGTLLVTEAGNTPNSGRVSVISAGGQRLSLIDGLPSGLAAPSLDADGPNGLALNGRTLYIANGEGDTFRNGPARGTTVPNPAGPSSPLFASILKVTFSDSIERLTAGFSLKLQDHSTLLDGAQLTLDNGAGAQATFEVLSLLRNGIPDPNTIYRNSHPYGLALLPSQPDTLYMNDAGMNTVVQVSLGSGRTKTLIRFPSTRNPTPAGPPVIEAVPTNVRAYGTQLLVSLLSGAPFVGGVARVMAVDPNTGASSLFIANLSSACSSG